MSKELTELKSYRMTAKEHEFVGEVAKLHRLTQRELIKRAVVLFNRHTPITNPTLEEV